MASCSRLQLPRKNDDAAPEPDAAETRLLAHATQNNLPLRSIFRGMQVIQDYFGVDLCQVPDHVNTRFDLRVSKGRKLSGEVLKLNIVKAFHDLGVYTTTSELKILATLTKGVVMAVEDQALPVFGLMRHPERGIPNNSIDQTLFKKIFC